MKGFSVSREQFWQMNFTCFNMGKLFKISKLAHSIGQLAHFFDPKNDPYITKKLAVLRQIKGRCIWANIEFVRRWRASGKATAGISARVWGWWLHGWGHSFDISGKTASVLGPLSSQVSARFRCCSECHLDMSIWSARGTSVLPDRLVNVWKALQTWRLSSRTRSMPSHEQRLHNEFVLSV